MTKNEQIKRLKDRNATLKNKVGYLLQNPPVMKSDFWNDGVNGLTGKKEDNDLNNLFIY